MVSGDSQGYLERAGRTLRETRATYYEDTRFSDAEYARRYRRVRERMSFRGLDCLIIYGNSPHALSSGQDVRYLSGYTHTMPSYVVVPYDGEPTLLPKLGAHVPEAFPQSAIEDVRWQTNDPGRVLAERVSELGYEDGTIGLIGARGTHLPTNEFHSLQTALPRAEFSFIDDLMERVCLRKTDAELESLREGAAITDRAMRALEDAIEPGVTERELAEAIVHSYAADGEQHFELVGSMDMANPDMPYPWKRQSSREIQNGDLVVTEISASNAQGYSGQILRSVAVGEEPTPHLQELYDVAEEIFYDVLDVLEPGATTEDVLDVASPLIEDNDLTIQAPILHGWGLGIQPPFIGTREEGAFPNTPFEFEEGQTVVIEPNPVPKGELNGGIFIGDMVEITSNGAETMQEYPMEFVQV